MHLTNQFAAIIYFILVVIVTITSFFAYVRDRYKPVTKHLIRLCLLVLCWQVSCIIYFLVDNESVALWAFDAKLAFVAFTPLQLLLLCVRFYNEESSKRAALVFKLLCIVPAITAALAVFSPFHNILRSELSIEQMEPLRIITNVRGPWFWVHSAYSYVLMVASIIVVFYKHSKLPRGFRMPSTLVAAGSMIALLSNAFVIFSPYTKNIDITVIGLSVALVFVYAGIVISDESSLLVQALDNIFSYLEDYIFILNANREVVEMNPAAKRWLSDLGIGDEISSFDGLLDMMSAGSKWEVQLDDTGGRDYHILMGEQISTYNLNEHPIVGYSGREIGVFAVFTDVTRYKLLIHRVEQTAVIDPLTNIGNRRGYEQELFRLDVTSSLPLSVILGDVNGLKSVNDSFGHAAGDQMLKMVAQVLCDACPEGTNAYRIGGDEFVILLSNTTNDAAEKIASEIRRILIQNSTALEYDISIALGIATKESMEQDIHACIERADKSMYLNKENDRRRFSRD